MTREDPRLRKIRRCADCGDESLGQACPLCGRHICDACRLFGHRCPNAERALWQRHVANGGD